MSSRINSSIVNELEHPEELSKFAHLVTVLESAGYATHLISPGSDMVLPLKADVLLVVITEKAKAELKQLQQQLSSYIIILLVTDWAVFNALEPAMLHNFPGIIDPTSLLAPTQMLMLVEQQQQLRKKDLLITKLNADLDFQKRTMGEIEIIKNAIVRNVSHELRTPLLQVKSAVSLIGEDVEDKTLVNYAENATARLESLVTNITMLGHSLDINLGPIILRDSVEYARRQIAWLWNRRADTSRIKITIAPNLPPVIADKQGLSIVLQLLVDNGLKFSEGEVEVMGYLKNDKIYIAVRDLGIGIAPDELESIFESFYQVDSSSTRRYGGTGIGLSLVKHILDRHNTQIEVESNPGNGSTFWFTLPFMEIM